MRISGTRRVRLLIAAAIGVGGSAAISVYNIFSGMGGGFIAAGALPTALSIGAVAYIILGGFSRLR
jgi:hypothetical protein